MGYIGTEPIPRASRVLTEGTLASDTQTIPVPGGFTPNNIAVYINGTRLRQTEYDDSSGSEIDAGETLSAGTEYTIEEFRSFELKDGVDGEFTTNDGKTVTVSNGIITSIV